jgi:pyruvate dehydrogenase E1 component
VDGTVGLSSYPHPWLMPDFWQFPTVSMGLGPMMAIYQARFLKYLQHRGIADRATARSGASAATARWTSRNRWARSAGRREKLDNLIFVVNCNLQRLDGPVRGNGKIIQELEGEFRGAGWNVIKLLWGSYWDPLLARDKDGVLRKLMMETVDGEYQAYKANDGAFVREHFFGKYPETREMVAKMSDDDIWRLQPRRPRSAQGLRGLPRGVNTKGQPTVILAKTVKGYGMGKSGEAQNTAHQQKKLDRRRHARLPRPLRHPDPRRQARRRAVLQARGKDSPEMKYLHERRKALGGYLPQRRPQGRRDAPVPDARRVPGVLDRPARPRDLHHHGLRALPDRAAARQAARPARGADRPDEARTFGMEGMFRQIGIYAPFGQNYTPQDKPTS